MSRIQDALKRAEESRPPRPSSGGAAPARDPMSAEMLDEVRRLEASLASWRLIPGKPAAPAASPAPQAAKPAQAADRWEEEIRRCKAELAAHDTGAARSQQQRASLQAQVEEQDRLVAQATAMLGTLQQRLHESELIVRQIEADKKSCAARLAALHNCQALAVAASEAERNLQAHEQTIARVSRVQQRVNERLSKHQLEAQQLQQAAERLRRQLSEATAQAQSVDEGAAGGEARS